MKLHTILVCLTVALAGCTTAGHQTGYLNANDYAQLNRGVYLAGYWSDAAARDSRKYKIIRIEKIDVERIVTKRDVTPKDVSTWLENSLRAQIESLGLGRSFTFDPNLPADAILELAVTDMTPGSPAGRFWAAELGVGHAEIQIEGVMKDSQTGKVIALLSERKRRSGSLGMQDIVGGDSGRSLVQWMVQETAPNIISEISASFYVS